MNLDSKSTNLLWHALVTFIWLFLSFLLYTIYKLVIRPLYRMNFYRKQGVSCTYFPVLGRYSTCISDVKNHKDAQYYFKLKSKFAPERLLCTNLGVDASIALHDPVLIKEFCLINSENYVKDTVFIELYSIILGKGLLTSEGDQWKAQRKILSSAFHFEFLKFNLPVTQSTAHEILYCLRNTSLKDVNILDVFQTITGEVIGKIFFGEQLNLYQLDGKPLTLGLADMISQIGVLNLSVERHLLGTGFIKKGILPKHKRLMTKADKFRKICRRIVEERKALRVSTKSDASKKDMLDILLEYSGEEGKVSEEEIVDQFITFFLAGMDTTGHLVTMAVYYLLKYPEMKEKMLQEVEQYYKSNISMEDLNKLEYTMAFLKETLRTMTPVPGLLLRRAIKDHKLKDIEIKKGDIVNIDYWYNHFNAKYFEKPEEFDPTRWLDKDKTIESYAFIPFSGGPRNCIGQHLALIEARIILAELLTMYEFEIKKDYDLKMDFKFLYGPVDPIIMGLAMKGK